VNSSVCDNGYTEGVSGLTTGDTRCWMLTFSVLKVRLSLVIFCPESATITGFYLK
jgi:hypothetical protein